MDNSGPSTSSTLNKYCLVPRCMSTSIKTPGKIFVSLPRPNQVKRRKLWLRAMRRNEKDISQKTNGYVCEDHFNFEEDMVNHLKWKLMGGNIFLKENVVPHIFECQNDRKRSVPPPARESSQKRVRKTLVTNLVNEFNSEVNATEKNPEDTSEGQEEISCLVSVPEDQTNLTEKYCQTDEISSTTVGVQCNRPNFRNKYTQTVVDTIKNIRNAACSPIKVPPQPTRKSKSIVTVNELNTSSSSITSISDTTPTVISSEQSSNLSDNSKVDRIKSISIERSNYLSVKKCRLYLGIPNDCYFVVTLLMKTIKCELRNIYITLKKIRTNLPFEYIGDDFGVTAGQAAKIFSKTVPAVSCCIKNYILWPEKNKIKLALPLAFRANYNNVQTVIDCFEIEIDKPSNPVWQAATWSEYKKSNTFKYLISVTPDGFINFLSQGFGGRTTDVAIVQKSDYLKILPKNCSVMADRGFKRIDVLLQPLNCILIRPPSVKVGSKSSKLEVLETKRIAALRIHVERVIRRIREFKILKPHACVNNKLVKYLDHIVIIAGGLINLQSNIIKT